MLLGMEGGLWGSVSVERLWGGVLDDAGKLKGDVNTSGIVFW